MQRIASASVWFFIYGFVLCHKAMYASVSASGDAIPKPSIMIQQDINKILVDATTRILKHFSKVTKNSNHEQTRLCDCSADPRLYV